MYKTTKKEFEEFKKECKYWIEYFGLKEWEIFFDHIDMKENRARCNYDISSMTSTIILGLKWAYFPDKNEIKRTAFHEVCELMLSKISCRIKTVYSDRTNYQCVHPVIRRLENTIFKEKRK